MKPTITLTVAGTPIAGSPLSAYLYPMADQNGEPAGNLVTSQELRIGATVLTCEVPDRNPPVTFNGHPYHYMLPPK